MEHPGFFETGRAVRLGGRRQGDGAELAPGAAPADAMIEDVRTLTDAGPRDLTFFDNRKYADRLKATHAGACLVAAGLRRARARYNRQARHPRPLSRVRAGAEAVLSGSRHMPDRARRRPGADRPLGRAGGGRHRRARRRHRPRGADRARHAHRRRRRRRLPRHDRPRLLHRPAGAPSPTPWSATGSSSMRACASARTASASPWAPKGHLKVPQIGRVIIQDDVEIGANDHRPRRP